MVVAVAAPAVVQLTSLVTSAEATRSHAILGATPMLFVQLLAGRVYLGAMLGQSGTNIHSSAAVLTSIAILGTIIAVYCLLKARLEWKLLIAFCLLVFVASLKNPMVSMSKPQWQELRDSPGIRYWFFPMIGFVWALTWCATLSRNEFFRFAGIAGLLMTCAGMVADWRYPAYTNNHFAKYAAQFAAAAPGTMVNIQIFPDGWMMRLVKRSPQCHNLLIGSVDQPTPGAQIAAPAPISGWVLADEPIRRVLIYVDRKPIESFVPDVRRSDVDSLYPQSPDKYKGWAGQVDLSSASPGRHEIEVRALEADGCESDFALIPVERPR